MSTDCLFCRIVAGEAPARTVYEDDEAVAFLDIGPWQRGHTLVIPRHHVADLYSGEPTMGRLGPAIDATARLLVGRLGADGLNLLSSAGAVAGQVVLHLHVHLVPRYADTPGLSNLFRPQRPSAAELDAVYAQIVTA